MDFPAETNDRSVEVGRFLSDSLSFVDSAVAPASRNSKTAEPIYCTAKNFRNSKGGQKGRGVVAFPWGYRIKHCGPLIPAGPGSFLSVDSEH